MNSYSNKQTLGFVKDGDIYEQYQIPEVTALAFLPEDMEEPSKRKAIVNLEYPYGQFVRMMYFNQDSHLSIAGLEVDTRADKLRILSLGNRRIAMGLDTRNRLLTVWEVTSSSGSDHFKEIGRAHV